MAVIILRAGTPYRLTIQATPEAYRTGQRLHMNKGALRGLYQRLMDKNSPFVLSSSHTGDQAQRSCLYDNLQL